MFTKKILLKLAAPILCDIFAPVIDRFVDAMDVMPDFMVENFRNPEPANYRTPIPP
jgi:hypothetical protein